MAETFVIVGASLAGATAAFTLREEGFDGDIVLVGAEPHAPYERPPLSKEILRGEWRPEEAFVRPAGTYVDNGIQTLFGASATRVDPGGRTVELADARMLRYDKLLIATGARNRRLPIPGIDLDGIYSLRTIEDADAIRAQATPGRHAMVVGMGFIGSEVAASLRRLGLTVTAIDASSAPLSRILGEEVGGVLEAVHRDEGVEMIFEDAVEAFEGPGRVQRVVTKSGRRIECDFAVVGLGVEPVVELVAGTGIAVDNGILVDEYCRTTLPDVFAAGDVANHYHPVFDRRMRVEHWQNAIKQGAAAARAMLDKGRPYDDVHWFWSDQYETNIQYAGFHTTWDSLVVRGSLLDQSFVAYYMNDGVVDAAVAINRGKDLRRAIPLIKARARVDEELLRDEEIDLRKVAASHV